MEQVNNQTGQVSEATVPLESENNVTDANSTAVQSESSKTLSNEEMQSIKGKWIRFVFRFYIRHGLPYTRFFCPPMPRYFQVVTY